MIESWDQIRHITLCCNSACKLTVMTAQVGQCVVVTQITHADAHLLSQEGKKSWTDSAKSWTATGLTYTQKGLEGIKNTVAGPSGTTTTGSTATGATDSNYNTGSAASATTGSSYATGQPTTGANIDPNRKY